MDSDLDAAGLQGQASNIDHVHVETAQRRDQDAQHLHHRLPELQTHHHQDLLSFNYLAAQQNSRTALVHEHQTAGSDDQHAVFSPVNPDDFYSTYRVHHHDNSHFHHPDALAMASASIRSPPPVHPNGDGGSQNHAAPAAPALTIPRPSNLRSVSNPVDSKGGPRMPSGKPSVKDLKKRFDQQNGGSTSIPRAPRPNVVPSRVKRQQPSSPSYSAVRSGIASEASANPKASATSSHTQRPKFMAEDQVSNNSQSFASRLAKPRSATSGNPKSSPSLTHPSPSTTSPQQSLPPTSSNTIHSQGLLFGEILPEQYDTSALGFGIESLRQPEATESRTNGQWTHQRSLSDPDVDLPSPGSWSNAAGNTETKPPSMSAPTTRSSRSHSDASTRKPPPQRIARKPATRKPNSPDPRLPPSSSKLPRSVRKINGPDDSSSPSSTRSSSPIALKRPPGEGRTSRATTPTTRAKTPTSRARTPIQSGTRLQTSSTGLPTSNSNGRLQAYAIPQPKLSPPLRSSRPRQPVSVATTASSRLKSVGQQRSVSASVAQMHSKPVDPSARRRKISVGPIDFEQRREHIRLAYSKSLKESQALEARQRAAEKRRKEMEEAAKAKAAAEAATKASMVPETQESLGKKTLESVEQLKGDTVHTIVEEPHTPEATTPIEAKEDVLNETPVPPRLVSPTADDKLASTVTIVKVPDSPTLGVPGSFPDVAPPQTTEHLRSTASPVSDTTEFDTEPQPNLAETPATPPKAPATVVKLSSPQHPASRQRAEYQYPFEDEPESPEQPISVKPAPEEPSKSRSIETVRPRLRQMIPGAFGDDDDAGEEMIAESETNEPEAAIVVSPPDSAIDHDHHHPLDEQPPTVPFPRLDMMDESDCHTEYDEDMPESNRSTLIHDHEDIGTDACTESTDDIARTEDCQSESHFGDHLSSRRASSCASSDAGAGDDLDYLTFKNQLPDNQPNSLLVPPTDSKRISGHSAWTDLTIDTSAHSDLEKSPDLLQDDDDNEPQSAFGHVTIFGSQVISRETELQSKEAYDEQASARPSCSSSRGSSAFLDYRSPETDTGDGFAISYLSTDQVASSPYIPLPGHEPPPVPPSASGSAMDSRRASSAFYDQSQRGSALISSSRESGDFASQTETPQTADTTSIATSEQYFGPSLNGDVGMNPDVTEGEELTDKDRRRLVQRRNVIKELLDTEAVFVRDMNIVEEIYKGTAEACPKLDNKTVKQIFRNTDEIIAFHTLFLGQVKEAVSSVYVPKTGRKVPKEDRSVEPPPSSKTVSDAKDREVLLGPVFHQNMEQLQTVHEGFLRSSDLAAKRLIQIQQDPTVKVWLNECNEVAKDLTAAWDLDSLLIKPMQRITKYPNLIITLLQHTPQDHPDREYLISAKDTLETAIIEINKTKKNFELVGQIVGNRKRKESDVKLGIARAFGKRVDKLQPAGNRPPEDPDYAKMSEKFGDDFLRLQVVLRDVEFYTRQVATYVREFLNYLSSVELVMRLQSGNYPEIESKWVQFNISIRDLEKVALDDHLTQVRKHVIEPFEQVIKAYGNPSLAMKKRQKRRLDFERNEQLKRGGKTGDAKLLELVEQYEALNDTLKKELPKLSTLTEKVGNICLGNFVRIQAKWYGIWKEKMKKVLVDCPDKPDLEEVVASFQRDFPYVQEQLASIGILQPVPKGRPSHSTAASSDDVLVSKIRSPRPSDVDTGRGRQLSLNGESVPSLPTPDFVKRNSESLSNSPTTGNKPLPASPHQYYYRDYYAGAGQSSSSTSGVTTDMTTSSRSVNGTAPTSTRPSTGRSFDSGPVPRQSTESASLHRRDSNTTYGSSQVPQDKRFSGLFHSALPLPDGPEDRDRSSRASSRERVPTHDGYNVLWLAASLFEFNIATTKHEAGYPYLVYQAGEIFDVIAEKGELWLAKNQDDPSEQVGWIWSKHFAKLADS
ncbi:unnamed protein product [Clonostachys byssicola]|uniref:DH domain-containing protein n=1 Tax=Clonostachys byssicola TaxID=160290 RepID=A0A9N9XTR2_9HYPO|nr:unnamed protein product [Clonostachys byssicola]